MKDLPERFPAQKVPPEKLAELAARARAAHADATAAAAAAGAEPTPPGRKRMTTTAANNVTPLQRFLNRLRLGVLDIAALVALAVLCSYLLVSFWNRPQKPLAQSAPPTLDGADGAVAGPNDKDTPTPLAPEKELNPFMLRTPEGRAAAVERYRGTKEGEMAVDAALRWLAYHQEPDGHWEVTKYEAQNKVNTAITSLALLAFLGAGHTEKVGVYKENVKRGIGWLKQMQQNNGLVFDTTDAGGHRGLGYPHAMALTALAEAAALGGVKDTLQAAQYAVDYAVSVHMEKKAGGWRYGPNQEPDLSVSAWYIAGLHSAKAAGLSIDDDVWVHITALLDRLEHKQSGDDGEISLFWYMAKNTHESTGHRLNAIGANSRLLLGGNSASAVPALKLMLAKGGAPVWGDGGDRCDLYYWYWGTQATFRLGGEYWNVWNGSLQKALVENQCKNGDDAGSWPVTGDFSGEWGRVGQTALGALCLESYYRYAVSGRAPFTPEELAGKKSAPPTDAERKAEAELRRRTAELAKQSEEQRKRDAAAAHQAEAESKVSFHFVDEPLADALKFLSRTTTIKVTATPAVLNGAPSINLRVSSMNLNLAVEWIARMVDAKVHAKPGEMLLCTEAELQALQNKPAAKPPVAPKAEGF